MKRILAWIVLPVFLLTGAFAKTHDAIVVGGGVAGLSTAWYLKDLDVVLLEKDAQVGGRVTGGIYRGWHYAMGAEYLGMPLGAMKELVRASGASLVEIPSPMDAHFYGGKFYWGGDGLGLLLSKKSALSVFNRFGKTLLMLARQFEREDELGDEDGLERLDEISAADWFKEQGFNKIYRDVYNVSSRGLFGANLDEVSARGVIPEFGFDFVDFAEEREEFDESENRPNRKERSGSYTFKHGIIEFVEGLAKRLGSRIQTDSEATGITRKGDQFEVAVRNAKGERRVLRARTLAMAVPVPIALRLAGSLLGEEERDIMRGIPYATYITVALMSDKPIFDKAFDLAVPDDGFFTDVYDSTWVQRNLDPKSGELGAGILGVYIAPASYKDRSLLEMDDATVLQRVRRDLENIFPDCWSLVKKTEIRRFPHAYPVMTLGAYRKLDRLHRLMNGQALQLAGDYMVYPTLEDAAESGKLAAQRIRNWINGKRHKQR